MRDFERLPTSNYWWQITNLSYDKLTLDESELEGTRFIYLDPPYAIKDSFMEKRVVCTTMN